MERADEIRERVRMKAVAERVQMFLRGLNPPPVSKTTGQGAFGIRGLEFEGTSNDLGIVKQ